MTGTTEIPDVSGSSMAQAVVVKKNDTKPKLVDQNNKVEGVPPREAAAPVVAASPPIASDLQKPETTIKVETPVASKPLAAPAPLPTAAPIAASDTAGSIGRDTNFGGTQSRFKRLDL